MFTWIWNGKYNYALENPTIRADKDGNVYGGGGTKATETTIQAAPTTPAPSAGESAASIAEARLKYDPMMAQQEMQLQQQYAPQQAALYQSMYNQFYPQMAASQQATQQQLYPYQSQIVEQGAKSALSGLNESYMNPEQQKAYEDQRAWATSQFIKNQANQANVQTGGQPYGGRTAAAQQQSLGNYLNQGILQDMQQRQNRQIQQQQMLNPYMQILYPQVGTQNPQLSNFQYQSAVPSADNLYNAYAQAAQPQYYATPGQAASPSPLWGLGGSILGGLAGGYGMGLGSSMRRT